MSNGIVIKTSPIDDTFYSLEDVSEVNRLIELKKNNTADESDTQRSFWVVVDAVIELWKKRNPTEYSSMIYEISVDRKEQGTMFGTKKDPKSTNKAQLRKKLEIPLFVGCAIRMLYSHDELPADKEFFNAIWKRYPMFRIASKI